MNRTELVDFNAARKFALPIATKLMLSFLVVIMIVSVVFIVVGVRIIGDRIAAETQEKVRNDLNAAREIFQNRLNQVGDVVQFTAESFFLREAMELGDITGAEIELNRVMNWEGLDILAVTDRYGYVLYRSNNPGVGGDNQGSDELVNQVLHLKIPVAAAEIVPGSTLALEGSEIAARAAIPFIETPHARIRPEQSQTDGLMLKAVAPIFDKEGRLIGTIYGGVLLNREFEIVDRIKQTVYQDVVYQGRDLGTATIFQDDVRISTNVKDETGNRAIGTRVSEEVYNQVFLQGEPWIGRAYVVTDWYITAYEPIHDVNNRIIGILYVGLLELRYRDIQRQTILTFLLIALAGVVASLLVSYFIAQRILGPVTKLVLASREVAAGHLDIQVDIRSDDEFRYLGDSFNRMAAALKRRDEELKEFATRKIMESERLALIGQLAANVAHELNNPLQGIVTYSHLMLEKMDGEDPKKNFVERIVGQANRCRDIIRGLLDFSRQRKPDMILSDLNAVMNESVSFVEHQALFHNIRIMRDFQANLPKIVIDPSQIQQVILNLIINAAEAMNGVGWLVLATRSLPGSDFVEIIVKDTGYGIRQEDMERIFDPFFTTKEIGHGTGLGLAISYGMVKMHGGTIKVESVVGQGSTFSVRLPLKQLAGERSENGSARAIAYH